jgi:hypothetical protein
MTKKNPTFRNARIRDSKLANQFKKPKNMILEKDVAKEKREKFILWNTFFRRNQHRFVETYFGVKLFPYQVLWFWLMSKSDVFVAICSRAAAKSFLVALFAITQAVLFPGSEIVIGASTLKQAGLIVSVKVKQLIDQSPMIAREIVSWTANMNNYEVIFANGSLLRVVAANEGGKGNRANLLILDEFRLLKKEIVDTVFIPFLYVRQANFKQLPEYADYPEEEPRKFSISSAGLKGEWWYADTISTIKMMIDGKGAGFFCTDYFVTLFHKIQTKKQIESQEELSDAFSFDMEYRNIPAGQSGKAYFKSQMFNRNIKNAFYPLRDDLVTLKKNPYAIPKVSGELRIVSLDIASRANRINDNTITGCTRLIPTHKGYRRMVVYLESSHGSNIVSQALRNKEIFYDFDADYIVMDMAQVGVAVYDSMSSITHSDKRGIDYAPFTVMESPLLDESIKKELRDRTLGVDALPIIFPITASAKLNSEIAVAFRAALQKKLFDFLATDTDAEDYLTQNNKEFFKVEDDISLRTFLLHPFVQTNLLVGECINLEMNVVNGLIKLTEGTGRKDRYTCLSYMNFFVSSALDRELLKDEDSGDEWDLIRSMTYVS